MSCNSKTTSVQRLVWTVGNNASSGDPNHFIPFSTVSVNKGETVKVSYTVRNPTRQVGTASYVQVRPAVRYFNTVPSFASADEAALSGFAAYSSAVNAWQYGTAYTTLNDDWQYADIGMWIQNVSSFTSIEGATVEMIIETRS